MAAASPLALGLVAMVVGGGPAYAQAVNLGGSSGNNIVADGRTRTNIVVDGTTTRITTGTVSKKTGFNSFSDFQQAAGTRVDLYVPDGAGNLVNIVRGPVVIDGLLNSYKDGTIGGNVYFSTSQGFVLGANGSINVGKLTVNTPTAGFLDGVVRPDGSVDDAAAAQLMHGVVPISPDGTIAIAGTINAMGGITLQGQDVDILGGEVQLDAAARQRLLFGATVNALDAVEGGRLVSHGGEVSIVAKGKARVGGQIDASATTQGKGGRIGVQGRDVLLAGTARLTADGRMEGAGGAVEMVADERLFVANGSAISARGAGDGAGGFVELSGRQAEIGAVNVALGSERGAAGTLLFDPYDLIIGGTVTDHGSGDDYSLIGTIVSDGANVVLQADNSITVSSGGSITTTSAGGQAGDITLEAPLITIADGAWLNAGTTGDITLRADVTPGLLSSTATAGIVIGTGGGTAPILSGRNISLLATATVDSGLLLLDLPTAHATIAVNGSTITASGAFRAEATASVTSGLGVLPIGIVVTDVLSSVSVGGAADITAASAALKATSSADVKIATESLAPADSTADGAVAISTITSKALVDVAGSARMAVTGALELAAKNDVVSVADATPQAAQFGASVAVSVIDVETSATIGGTAQVAAGSLGLDARTTSAVTVTAKAAAGGAGEPQAGSKTKEQLDKYGDEASTSEGGVSVVGGFAVSDLTSTTLARLASAVAATVSGATAVTTQSANSATVVADGSAVESSTGVGVAVGINLAHVGNDALVAQGLTTGSLDVSAGMGNAAGNVFTTTATSGAGAKNVGVAGSLAVNLVDTQSSARLGTGAAVTVTGAVSLTAANTASSTARAVPTEAGATGDTVGVGVSAALNIVANRATAELADNTTLAGAGALTLSASGLYAVESEAKAGSAGGISVTPALALSMASNTTTARLGSGATLSAGSVALSAVQQSTITTKASAKAKGSDVAVGAALALALVNDSVSATTARNVSAPSAVSFTAMGASLSTLEAEASAAGGKAAKDDGSADGEKDVDGKVDDQLTAAKTKQDKAGVGDADQKSKTGADVNDKAGRSASTSEGGVSVAAAIGVNVQTATVTAAVPDAVTITSGGALTLRSAANTDGKVTADGSAVAAEGTSGPAVGIGAAVAVNKVAASNTARLGVATHSVGGLTIEALKTDIAAKVADAGSTAVRADAYLAKATSGAGASKVGVAGSLALNLIDTESSARIAASASVAVTGGGAVTLTADNRSGITATALPTEAGTSGGKVGVGVSAAINVVANRAIAELADGATLTGTGARTLAANGVFTAEAEAKAGSKGGISITPALGLNLINNTTTARLGSGGTLSAGSVALSAVQQSSVTTKASAKAAGESVAVGAALALALVNDTVTATTARNITTTGAVSFTAQGKSSGELSAEAGAEGAKAAKDDGSADGEKDVDGKVDDQLATAKTKQDNAGVGDAEQKGKTDTDVNGSDAKAKRSAKTEEGKVSVAAAVAVNVTDATVTAVVPDGVAISAGGSLTLASANTTGGTITADGSAAKAEIAIGVAVAVNAVEKTNTARLGVATHSANGVTVKATQFGSDPANPDIDLYEATATSGAGGGKVGIAGSLALNLVDARTSAQVATGASVNAGTGASALTANQRITAKASALPTATGGASGGKVGVGASVALNLITDATDATLSDGAAFSGGASLAVSANSVLSTTTKAEAGAAGGIAVDAVVALAMLDQTTTARIGTSATGLTVSGAVSVSATSGGDHTASADGNVKAGNVGVGAAAAVIIGAGDQNGILANTSVTSASLARNVSAASLAIAASAGRTYVAEASATAGGGKSDSADSDKAPAKPATSTKTLDDTKDYQKGNDAADEQSKGKPEGTGAGGSGGKVQVAAAVGVAVSQDVVTADIAAGVIVSATGHVAVTAANSVDMATVGSGQAGQFGGSSNAQVGVGVGVALGINTSTTAATIGAGAQITQAGGVDVTATTRENVGDAFKERLTARAIAGASSSKVSVAGALAVGISLTSNTATVGDNVVIASTGAVRIATDSQSQLSAKALAGSYTSGNAAIGASIATVYSERDLVAAIGDGADVAGTDVSVTAVSRKVDTPPSWLNGLLNVDDFDLGALKDKFGNVEEDLKTKPLLGQSNYYAEAIGGAAAPSGVAVQGSFAVMVFDDAVTASIGASTITASGAVTLDAKNDFAAKAMSGGVAVGNSVGVGVSATVVVSSGTTRALLADNATVTSTGAFADTATASQDILTIGLAAGAASTAGIAGVANVVVSTNTVEALVGKAATVTAGGSATLAAQNDFTTFGVAAGMGAGSTAGVGAGASAIIVNNVTRAALADGTSAADAVTIDAAGAFGISARASETGTAITFAGGAAGTAGVGAGAAVYVLGTTTEALAGNFAQIGQVTAPSKLDIDAEDTTTLTTVAGSLGVGGTAGVGAGAAVGVVGKTVTAAIGSNATVAATDIGISAADLVTSATVGIGAGVGGTAGVAGAVAVFSISDTTIARIAENAVVHAQNNVAVLAQNGTSLDTIAGSMGGGGTAGVGASASVTVIDTTTHALIADNAEVTALGNGAARDYVAGYDGALVSYGAGDDFAGPDLDRYDLEDPAGDAAAPITADDAMTAGLKLLAQKRVASPITQSANGVIVNAASTTEVRAMAVGGAVGGAAGVSLAADVPVITTDTSASIGAGALNNQGPGAANSQQSVIVAAASDLYHFGLAGSLAGGGAAGVGGGGSVAIVDATTHAGIGTGTTTSAARDIGVTARAREDFVSVAAAAAGGGTVGVAGGVTVIVVDATTTATLAGTAFAGRNVDVVADDKTRVSMLAGSIAIGAAGGGVGASIGVVKLDKTVTSVIADNAMVTALGVGGTRGVNTGLSFTDTRLASGINVLANSNQSVFTLAVAGAGGLYVGIAGAVTLELVDATTTAAIGAGAQINTIGGNAGAAVTQDVVVTARDSTATLVIDGGVAGGLVGVAGAVDVGVFRNTAAASIGDGATVNARRHVAVSGLSNKAGSSTAVSAAGGIVGVAAGISIYSYGDGVAPDGEGNQQIADSSEDGGGSLGGITGMADDQANNGEANGLLASSDDARVRGISQSAQDKRTALDFTGAATSTGAPAGTSATIGSATLNAGSVAVRSRDDLDVKLITGAVAGGAVGVGAGIGVLTVDTGNTARLADTAAVVTGDLAVAATTSHTLGAVSIAGSLGLGAAVSGDVAVITDTSRASAYISGGTLRVTGGAAVNTTSTRTASAEGYGVAVAAGGAVGISSAVITLGGTVGAHVEDSAIGTAGNRAGSVTVEASATDRATSYTIAGSGGIGLALQGSVALATIGTTTSAYFDNAAIYASGGVALRSLSQQQAAAEAEGYAVAGTLAAGASVATARITAASSATVGGGSLLDAGSIEVSAALGPASSATPAAKASASGSSGALVGITATEASANNTSSSKALVENSTLRASGLVKVAATGESSQRAGSSGLAVGIVAIGSNTARSLSNVTTTALLRDISSTSNGFTAGAVEVSATGTDANYATSEAGSGGVVAGSAARAETTTTSTTLAAIETSDESKRYTVAADGLVTIAALHTASFGGSVDSTQASLAGKSGATLVHTVAATVDAHLGDYATLRAADLSISAKNLTQNFFLGGEPAFGLYPGATAKSGFNSDAAGWNVNSGSGGLIDLPAGSVAVNVAHTTSATIGQAADVHLLAKSAGTSRLAVEAYNEVIAHQKAKLDSGGAIAVAAAEIMMTVNAAADVSVGADSDVVVDIGDIAMAAWGQADLEARSAATTYGVAGAPSGKAYALYTGANTIDVGHNVRLIAADGITPLDGSLPTSGTVSLGAGAGLDGRQAALRFRTTVDLFNNTAIPIDTTPDARVATNIVSNVAVRASDPAPSGTPLYGVSSAGDITLRALGGDITASAVGIGKNIYLEALSEVASAISNVFGGDDVTFEVHGGSTSLSNSGTATIDGLLYAGLQRHKTLTISYTDADCDIDINACLAPAVDGEIGYTVSAPEDIGTTILNRLDELELLLFEYGNDPVAKGAYQSEIRFLQTKLAALGLGSFDSSGKFVPSAYVPPNPTVLQAQIDAEHGKIATVTTFFNSTAGTLVSASGTDLAAGLSTARTDLQSNSTTVRSTVQTFINGMPTGTPTQVTAKTDAQNEYNTRSTAITGLVTAGNTAAATIAARVADNQTQQTTITTNLATIETQRALLEQARIAGNTANETAAQQAIDAAFLAIKGALGTIETNNATIKTQSATVKQNALDLKSAVTGLRDWAKGLSGAGSSFDGLATNITAIGNLTDNIAATAGGGVASGLSESLYNFSAGIDTEVAKLLNEPTDPGTVGGYNTLSQYFNLLGTLTGNVVSYTELKNAPPTALKTRSIVVADTSARLANVSIFADRLLGGTGMLEAPGDARIEITNNTAYTLKLGNLIIPDYDAANVRFNGVLVHDAADIDDLNPTGTAPVGLFVRDGLSSSRAQVVINSTYNPDSLHPATTPPLYGTPQVAPDIVLASGKKIANPTGAVNITSAAGNIYIQGEIQAGSLSILAKNGDFVSSYVNGFDHVGGDPGSFNNPLNTAEAGRGIIVNGSISIAARYLNVNSTIQSGIASWSLNLGTNPTLTTTVASAIGLQQSVVDAAVDAYLNAIITTKNPISALVDLGGGVTLNMGPAGLRSDETAGLITAIKAYLADTGPNPSPVYNVKIAGVLQPINIKDYISGGISGQLEFSLATLQAYMGTSGATPAAAYKLVTGSDPGAIGAAYDALNDQFVVDSTRVSGGYIELYGQIINTAYVASGEPVGRLNVLDGFGTIAITNDTGIPVVLQALHAGEDNGGNGRGVEGKIVITDVTGVSVDTQGTPTVDIRRTTYTRDYVPGASAGQVRILTELGALDDNGNFVLAGTTTTSVGGDRSATYNPTANMRYVWTTGTDYKRVSNTSYTRDSFFTISALTVASRWNEMVVEGTPTIESVRRLPDGTYLTTSTSLQPQAAINWSDSAHRTQLVTSTYPAEVANSTLASQPYVTSTYYYADPSKIVVDEGPTSKTCIGWTLCTVWEVTTHYTVTQRYTEITSHSLKADNPIGINFIGANAGAITVGSASDVLLLGNVTNAGGDVSIAAGTGGAQASIATVGPGAVVTGRNIALDATGSIGGVNYAGVPGGLPPITDSPAVAVMLKGGALDARAGTGNVVVSTRGGLVVGEVSSGGTLATGGRIDLTALLSITGADASSLIQGQRVSLSAGGAIGSTVAGQLLKVNTGFTADPAYRPFGDPAVDSTLVQTPYYGLTAIAGGDIGIASGTWSGNADGTMLVDKVHSLGGDVRLAATGRILDNNPVESIDSRTYEQLVSYWESLGLLATDDARGIDGTLNADKQAATIAAFETARTQAYEQYWRIRGDGAYDPDLVISVVPGSAQYDALSQQFDALVRAENPGFDDTAVAAAVAQRIADFGTQQTALYHELHTEVGGLTATYVAGYHYDASPDEKAELTRGATWTERQLAFSLSPGALKTVTATNPIVKEPNVAGRTVTIEAGLGVGETVGAGTSDVGISIKADIDPRDMTIAQKVALAAAERSDLQLTVKFGGGTVDIPLGTDYADMNATQQAAFDAAVAGSIPAADMTIVILAKRPLNFNAPDALNVTVTTPPDGTTLDKGTAYLASRGNGALGTIAVPGETRIKVIGTIINAPGGSAVNTGNLILEAAQGGIGAGIDPLASPAGTSYPPLQLALQSNSTLTARAQNGVNIEFTGDARIDTVYSPQDVRLTATGSLLNANDDLLINILGTKVLLDAAGSIGTASHALNVGSNLGGGITASAGGLINLFGAAGHQFVVSGATSTSGSIKLTAALEGVIDGAVTAPGRIDLAAGTRLVVSSHGQVHTLADLIDVRAGVLKMIDGASLLTSAGRIAIATDGDALVTGIESGASDAGGDVAVSIVSGGRVFAGTDDDRIFDIKAMAPGASVTVTAALGIGDKTQANAKWQDAAGDVPGSANAVTDTPNPLRILSSAVALAATEGDIYAALLADPVTVRAVAGDGSIYLTAVGKFHGTLLEALKGTVSVEAGGDIDIDQLHALKVILDTEGALRLADLEVGEEAVLRANELEANIRQVPPGPDPLKLTLTGGKGKVGTWASVTVDAPAGLILPLLRFYESDVKTTAKFVSVLSAYVPGSAKLTTPLQKLLVENRSPAPLPGFNVQMFQPGFAYGLTIDNFHTTTNAFVVRYDRSAEVTDVLDRLPYEGASFVRDTIRAMLHGMPLDRLLVVTMGADGEWEEREILFEDEGERIVIDGVTYPVLTKGPPPAVQLGDITP